MPRYGPCVFVCDGRVAAAAGREMSSIGVLCGRIQCGESTRVADGSGVMRKSVDFPGVPAQAQKKHGVGGYSGIKG
jgi:hypothetical protein